ncbi:MAG: DUF1847 domain-containing protein [Bacillota bacterium]|nr:DUF1847 domain-containing protein [Bacillota bacterium]MDW7676860.1 DUF1847 domain-containing protein [Bacillota bacterium]
MNKNQPTCAKCKIKTPEKACRKTDGNAPAFCPTKNIPEVLSSIEKIYADPKIREFARQASIQEAEGYANRELKLPVRYPVKNRLEEICEFADRMGYKRLGLAYCGGLQQEADAVNQVFEAAGFEVLSVVCKIGCRPKEEIGLNDQQKVRIGEFESMCNPIGQAKVLNQAGADFNVVLGLCVGHDSLFFMNTTIPTTVLAVKDRVLGHNPLAAVYTLGSYSERLIKK